MTLWFRLREWQWMRNGLALPLLLIPYWLKWPDPPAPFTSTYVMGFVLSGAMLLAIGLWLLLGMPGIGRFFQRGSRLGWAIAWSLLTFWAILTQTWAFVERQEPGVAQNFALQMLLVGGYCFMLACAAPSPRFVLRIFVLNGVIAGMIGGAQVACQCSLGLSDLGEVTLDPMRSGVSVIAAEGIRWLRPYGLLPHPNVNAGMFIVGLFAAAGLFLKDMARHIPTTSNTTGKSVFVGATHGSPLRESQLNLNTHEDGSTDWKRARHTKLLRFVALLIFAGIGWMLLLSFSRGAWAGTGLGALVVLAGVIGRRELRKRLLLLAALGISLVLIFFVVHRPLIVARTGAGQENTEMRSLADRVVYGQIAQAAIAKAPLIGLGGGNTPWYAATYIALNTDYELQGDHVHNIYLETWSDLGLIGFVLFAVLQGFGVFAAVQSYRRTRDVARLMMIGAWVALAVVGFVDHYPWSLIMGQTLWMAPIAVAMGEKTELQRRDITNLQNS